MINEERIFGLDLMQAAAITLILFAQCLWILPQTIGIISQLTGIFDFLGVEIFLVLSGFTIGRMLLPYFTAQEFGRTAFSVVLRKTAIRILPVYFLILLLNFLIAVLNNYSIESGWKYIFLFQNFASPMPPLFPESWIVPVIFFAALLLFLTLFLLNRFLKTDSKPPLFFYATLLLILIFLLTKYLYNMTAATTTIDQWNVEVKSVAIYRMDAVFIGVLFSALQFLFHPIWIKLKLLFPLLGFFGLAFIFVGVGHFHLFIQDYKLFWNVFYLPITSVFIALLLPFLSECIFAPSFIRRPVSFVAMISYAVYLLHFGVVFQLMKYLYPAAIVTVQNLFWFVFLYIAITVFLGSVLFQFYQYHIIKKVSKKP